MIINPGFIYLSNSKKIYLSFDYNKHFYIMLKFYDILGSSPAIPRKYYKSPISQI